MSSTHPTRGRRSYGTGSLYTRTDRNGRETYYGIGYRNGRRFNRKLGLKRTPDTPAGLTVKQAEAALAALMGNAEVAGTVGERLSMGEVAERYLLHAKRRGRKHSTLGNLESELRVHVVARSSPARPSTPSSRATWPSSCWRWSARGSPPRRSATWSATLSAMCNYASNPQRPWCVSNPCVGAELPAVAESEDIRFLTLDEVDLLIQHAPAGMFQDLDRAMYRVAAMTGLRRGELLALRWRDVDWLAQRIRVRQNFVRGEFGTPKSRRSTRSVPMALEVAAELERLSQVSRWQGR